MLENGQILTCGHINDKDGVGVNVNGLVTYNQLLIACLLFLSFLVLSIMGRNHLNVTIIDLKRVGDFHDEIVFGGVSLFKTN